MNESLRYQRILTLAILAIGLAVFVLLIFAVPSNHTLAWGWTLGLITGVGIFRYRAATVLSLFDRPQEEWAQASIKASIISYGLTIAVSSGALVLMRYTEYKLFHPYAVLGGILLERVVLWADGFIRPFTMSKKTEEEQV